MLNLRPGGSGPAGSAQNFNIETLLPRAVNIIFIIAVIVFFFMLVIGGIRWISSGGDKGQTESAKGQITAAIIGLVIVLSTYAIVSLIGAFFGTGDIIGNLDLNAI